MSMDELKGMIDRSMTLSNALNTNGMQHLLKSIGTYDSFTAPYKNHVLERSLGLAGMNKLIDGLDKYKAVFGISSTDWLLKNSALKQISLPNNMFNLSKGFGYEIANILAQRADQYDMTKAMTQGLGSIIGSGSFARILDTQSSILNQITGLSTIGIKPNQYRNVLNTLGTLSASAVSKSLSSSLSASYPDLEETANEVAEITNSIARQNQVTAADLEGIYTLINDLNQRLSSVDKSEFKTFGFWLCVIGLFFGIYTLIQQKLDASNPNTAPATQQQIADLRDKLISTYHDNINLYAPTRMVDRLVKLHLKPRIKSRCLMVLIPNSMVSVINTKSKWALVTCLDKDNLPVTGWILKKYLLKQKAP